MSSYGKIQELLGKDAAYLLDHTCRTISKDMLHLPGSDFVERVMAPTDRSCNVLRNLQTIYNTGRLSGTGYLSILAWIDQIDPSLNKP